MHLKSIDLDNFPANETAQRMLSRVSPIYDRSYVMKWLYQVMGVELEEMKYYIKTFPLQRFPETASWGIRYLEQKYEIKPDESLELQQRRENAIAARPYRGAITPYRIEQAILDICGIRATVRERAKEYYFEIITDETNKTFDYTKVVEIVNKIKPSHMDYGLQINKIAVGNVCLGGVVQKFKEITLKEV